MSKAFHNVGIGEKSAKKVVLELYLLYFVPLSSFSAAVLADL